MSFCTMCGKEHTVEELEKGVCSCGAPVENAVTAENVEQAKKDDNFEDFKEDAIEKAEEIKKASLGFIDKIVEKAKNVPILAGIFEKVDKKLHPIIVVTPILVVVALILGIIAGYTSAGSHMTPLNDFLKYANKKTASDENYTKSLMADFRYDLLKKAENILKNNDDYSDALEKANEDLEDGFDELDDEFKKWKIKFEKKSEEKMDKDDIKDFQDTLEDYYDAVAEDTLDNFDDILDDEDELESYADMFDLSEKETKNLINAYIKYYKSFEKVNIQEAWEVKGKFVVTADDDEFKTETVKLYFVKMNGDWVYAGCDGSLSLEDSDGCFDFLMDYLEDSYITK